MPRLSVLPTIGRSTSYLDFRSTSHDGEGKVPGEFEYTQMNGMALVTSSIDKGPGSRIPRIGYGNASEHSSFFPTKSLLDLTAIQLKCWGMLDFSAS